MNPRDDPTIGDPEFLDLVFDEALERIEDGLALDVDSFVADREHLRAQVEELVHVAQQITAVRPLISALVPGYTLVSELGRGGMGAVYLARQDRAGGRLVALKVLPPSAAPTGNAKARFLSEASAIARLRHANIVTVHDVIYSDSTCAYAMEWIDGKSLAQLIERLRSDKATKRRSDEGKNQNRDRNGAVNGSDGATNGSDEATKRQGDEEESQNRDRNGAVNGSDGAIPARRGRLRDEGNRAVPMFIGIRERSAEPTLAQVRETLGAPADAIGETSYSVLVCRIGLAIARALQTVHDAGLVHRDVKPSNILLRRDGTPLLSDFGLVRETDTTVVTQTGHFVGTPAFAAPEQLRGEHENFDARTDVYGLGVTLYHALTLQLPYTARGPGELLKEIEAGPSSSVRKLNPRVPRDLETIVAKAMDGDPCRRYAFAAEMADDLERLLNLQPIRARPAGVVTRTSKLLRRNRRSVVAAVAGGSLATAAAVVLVLYLFWLPGWVDSTLAAARVRLLNPKYSEVVYSHLAPIEQHTRDDVWRKSAAGAADRYHAALEDYRRAVIGATLLGRSNVISLERDTVILATALIENRMEDTHTAGLLPKYAPVTHKLAVEWMNAGRPTPVDAAELEKTDAQDLRCLGLLGYLCFEPLVSIRAWERSGFDLASPPDPLVDAALGQVYLVYRNGPRAMVRLERAFRAFPDSGYLVVALADAAGRCGEQTLVQRLLDIASTRDLREFDPFWALIRTRAGFHAARQAPGDHEEACRLFEEFIQNKKAPSGFLDYASYHSGRGELKEALRVYHRLILARSTDVEQRPHFVDGVERWWGSLNEEERLSYRQENAKVYDDVKYHTIYQDYQESLRMVAERAEPDATTELTITIKVPEPPIQTSPIDVPTPN